MAVCYRQRQEGSVNSGGRSRSAAQSWSHPLGGLSVGRCVANIGQPCARHLQRMSDRGDAVWRWLLGRNLIPARHHLETPRHLCTPMLITVDPAYGGSTWREVCSKRLRGGLMHFLN